MVTPKDLWTTGTLLVAVLSQINPPINPRSSSLLSHQTSWAVHQWLPSAVPLLIPCLLMLSCHQYYSIPFAFLIYYLAHDSLPYQSILPCSLLIPLLRSLFILPMLTHCCLSHAYWSLTKPLPITYQSLTNSAYSLPFLYFNAVSPHVFKPLGSAQWWESPISWIPLYSALSGCIRQLSLSTLSLVGFSEGLKALISQVYSIYSSPTLSLGSSGV